MPLLIETKDLTTTVPLNNGDILTTVDGVNLSIEEGKSYAVVGKSGAGKTSLLSVLGLLNQSFEGDYLYKGQRISQMKDSRLSALRAKEFGYVFQNYSLIQHLRVWENIELPMIYAKCGWTGAQRRNRVRDLLEQVMLPDKEKSYPSALSGGEQQRVAIARAIAVEPEVILCDEPTGALDKKTGESIIHLLHHIVKQEKSTLLMVTHDGDVAATCDIVFSMDEGRIYHASSDH